MAAIVLAGCGSGAASLSAHKTTESDNGIGALPSWIPKSAVDHDVDRPLVGTVADPALTVQGLPVKVVTPHYSVTAVVTGPIVPGEGLSYRPPATTCTWFVTLSGATAPVPVSVADFDSINAEGEIFRPYLVPGTTPPPAVLMPGKKVTFQIRAGETVGEGLIRWAPNGQNIVAKWDFTVEND